MNEQLKKELVENLRTSGFYSEMMAIRACREAGWNCHGSFTYFDRDERTTRECDFEAMQEWKELRRDGSSVKVAAWLIGQVKKSERPWIVFADRNPGTRFEDGLENLIHVSAVEKRWKIGASLRRKSPTLENGWAGSGIHEAFKKPSDTSKWYSAFVSVCKAGETAYEMLTNVKGAPVAQLVKPIVVLDGLLVTAELGDDAQVVLTEADHAGFRFEYRSDRYDRMAYYVDLVTLAGLPRYLERTAKRMTAVLRMFQRTGARS